MTAAQPSDRSAPPASRRRWETVLLVAVGGYTGASLRHLAGRLLPAPVDTLAVNVVGAAVLALVLYGTIHGVAVSRRMRLLIGTGVLSSFTTYSTFALDVARAAPARATVIVAATYGGGILAVVAVGWFVRRRTGRSGVRVT